MLQVSGEEAWSQHKPLLCFLVTKGNILDSEKTFLAECEHFFLRTLTFSHNATGEVHQEQGANSLVAAPRGGS